MYSDASHHGNSTVPGESAPASSTAHKRRSLPVGERSSIADAYADLTGTRSREAPPKLETSGDMNGNNGAYDHGSKHRMQYFEGHFQYKDNSMSAARERVHRESPVIAELKTNVIIKDEFTLVTDLSYHLGARYTRPDSSIMINVEHSACLALAGTFEPCYVLTISALPSQMQPTINKRNAALIQSFMADVLSVPPERGVLKFVPIPDENLAMNGSTMLGEIERLEKHQGEDREGGLRKAFAGGRKSMHQNKSQPELDASAPKPTANGATTTAAKRLSQQQQKRGSAYLDSHTIFELPTTEHATHADRDRPTTTHGSDNYAAPNGLRLNGISTEDMVGESSRSTTGRPKTIGARPDGPSRSSSAHSAATRSRTPEPMPPPPLNLSTKTPPPPPTTTTQTTKRYSSSGAPALEPRKSSLAASSKPPNPNSVATPVYSHDAQNPSSSAAALPRRTSHHSTTSAAPKRQHADTATNKPASALANKNREPSSSGKDRDSKASDAAANTARRRSNITATPKMPASSSSIAAPPPPPIPENRTPRVSKRKSFMSVFRR